MDTLVIVSENLNEISEILSDSQSKNSWIEYIPTIVGLVEVLLLGAYVYFTKGTFDQIKKQTDLQLKAYLGVDDKLLSETDLKGSKIISDCLNLTFSNDWKTILKNSFSDFGDDIFDGKYYSLEFSNHGNVDIKKFNIESTVIISNSTDVIETRKLVSSEEKQFSTELVHYLKKGETIIIPLFSTAVFPNFIITTKVKFEDARSEKYEEVKIDFNGTNSHFT